MQSFNSVPLQTGSEHKRRLAFPQSQQNFESNQGRGPDLLRWEHHSMQIFHLNSSDIAALSVPDSEMVYEFHWSYAESEVTLIPAARLPCIENLPAPLLAKNVLQYSTAGILKNLLLTACILTIFGDLLLSQKKLHVCSIRVLDLETLSFPIRTLSGARSENTVRISRAIQQFRIPLGCIITPVKSTDSQIMIF